MTQRKAIQWIKELKGSEEILEFYYADSFIKACDMAIKALEKQEKIKEIIENANQWSKKDIVVKAQAFCDIEKILRSDEE